MEASLKISIGETHLEVEGSEAFVEKTYSDFKEFLSKGPPPAVERSKKTPVAENGDVFTEKMTPRKSKAGGKTGTKSAKTFERLDINLRPTGKTSLKDFVATYASPTKDELYLLSVSYLNSVLGIKDVTADHIYTCLDELGKRVPTHLKQVLINTKNEKGWIDYADGKITISIKGQNHLKFDIEKAK